MLCQIIWSELNAAEKCPDWQPGDRGSVSLTITERSRSISYCQGNSQVSPLGLEVSLWDWTGTCPLKFACLVFIVFLTHHILTLKKNSTIPSPAQMLPLPGSLSSCVPAHLKNLPSDSLAVCYPPMILGFYISVDQTSNHIHLFF